MRQGGSNGGTDGTADSGLMLPPAPTINSTS